MPPSSSATSCTHPPATGLVWFRRDLRLSDHAALAEALRCCTQVHGVFVFDTTIVSTLPPDDRRVAFIHAALATLIATLGQMGRGIHVEIGDPRIILPRLMQRLQVDTLFANEDYEPDAAQRDATLAAQLQAEGRQLLLLKDQVIFAPTEVLAGSGRPYQIYTPYRNAWRRRLSSQGASASEAHPVALNPAQWCTPPLPLPTLSALGMHCTIPLLLEAGEQAAHALLDEFSTRIGSYMQRRNYPAQKGPSYLSVHLRFGTLSVRQALRCALARCAQHDTAEGAQVWIDELIWREFFFMILFFHPWVSTRAFRPEYDALIWETGPEAEAHFRAWCTGRTGYPLIDAGMRQLHQSGYMHNRLRMVCASFLVKHLGIDWRRGEAWFAAWLNDFDLAANNGGWQWVASCGCDAQPYFRIFNPLTQSKNYDPDGRFIRRYVPELAALPDRHIHAPWQADARTLTHAGIVLGQHYPLPCVDHVQARSRTLARYAAVRA